MTEAQWQACEEPVGLYGEVRERVSARQLRLFACACVRQVWALLDDARSSRAVCVSELLADGQVSGVEVSDALEAAYAAEGEAATAHGTGSAAEDFAVAARYALVPNALIAFAAANRTACANPDAKSGRQRVQAALFRDILGNPHRPVTLAPNLRTQLVVSLAQAAYDERHLPSGELDAERLLILADALEDAGCGDAALLEHLSSPGPHVRGCWVVDLLLGKE